MLLHEGVENTHHLHEASAKAGELGDEENVVFFRLVKKGSQFPLGEFAGTADYLFNPAVNVQLLLICIFEDFKPLVVGGLFVG